MSQLIPYMPGAEPSFQRGGAIGCLGLHGFTASPDEVRWLGQHLTQQGFTTYIPRLPGHGTIAPDLARTRWRDWYAAALDGYRLLRAQCEQVFVVGHSMGGMLALLLATDADFPVDGIVGLAVPVKFDHPLIGLLRWLRYTRPYIVFPDEPGFPERLRETRQQRGEPDVGLVKYHRWSTHAIHEMNVMAGVLRDRLPLVKAPLLLVYSENDEVIPLKNRDWVASGVSSVILEQQTLQNSSHILGQDMEREQVFEWVTDFIRRQANASGNG